MIEGILSEYCMEQFRRFADHWYAKYISYIMWVEALVIMRSVFDRKTSVIFDLWLFDRFS